MKRVCIFLGVAVLLVSGAVAQSVEFLVYDPQVDTSPPDLSNNHIYGPHIDGNPMPMPDHLFQFGFRDRWSSYSESEKWYYVEGLLIGAMTGGLKRKVLTLSSLHTSPHDFVVEEFNRLYAQPENKNIPPQVMIEYVLQRT